MFLHRARRVGKPGNHYIAMSFDEFPVEDTLSRAAADLSLQVGGADGITATKGSGANLILGDQKLEKLHKVAYVHTGAGGSSIVAEAAHRGIELCILRSENEFTAFLPAIEAAGIKLDLVVIEPNADFVFATLSAKHGIRHRMLSPGADVMESIMDAFARHRRAQAQSAPHAPATAVAPPPEAKSPGFDILAVEDNPINLLVVEQILESLGLNFVVAASGGEALGKIAACRPQVVLVDITLPDMDIDAFMQGLEPALRDSGIRPPVIGLTSSDSAEQRQILRQAGLADVVAKPLSPEAIDRVVRKHLLHEKSHGSLPKSAA
jgi:CheY-like chemotaxis protein